MNRIRYSVPLLILMVFLGMGSPGWGQAYRGRGRVKGYVTDTEGNPLEGVKVKLWHVEKAAGFEVTTDKHGKWVAAFIRGGDWNIDFEKPGYGPKKITVHLKELGKNEDIRVQMEKLQAPAIPAELLDRVDESNRLFQEQKYEEALDLLQKLAEEYPDVKVLHWNIGNCYFAMGDYEKAVEHYLIAKEEYPNKQEFWMAVGNAYMQMKMFDKATEAYNNIGLENIDDPAALYNLGEVTLSQNQLDISIKALKQAVALKPDFADALYLLGTAYIAKGDKANAKTVLEQYLQLDSTSDRAKEVKILLKSVQ